MGGLGRGYVGEVLYYRTPFFSFQFVISVSYRLSRSKD